VLQEGDPDDGRVVMFAVPAGSMNWREAMVVGKTF